MVVKSIDEIKKALSKVEGKGDPIVAAGTTESGKSTAMGALAKTEVVQELLSIREASGKGSTASASIIATDYSGIPEDKLIMTGRLSSMTIADCNDDNELLGNVIYAAAKDYNRNPKEDIYKLKMKKALSNALKHPANESLAYKIKGMEENDFDELLEIILLFPINEVMIVFNEMLAKSLKKGQKGVRIFIELLSGRPDFASEIIKYWNFIVKIINRDVEILKEELENSGAFVESFSDGSSKFIVVLGQEDINKEMTKTLLKSEEGSKEYLFSDISLIFRGAVYLFNVDNVNLLMVSEYEGEKIHCVRFIDTQGLFHATGIKTKDESERIIDILSEYHSNKLVLVINSFVTDTVKDGYEAVRIMLQEANRNIEIYILYTHWDEYFKNYSQQSTIKTRFSRGTTQIDWKQKFAKAISDQDELSNIFKESLLSNTSRKKPEIIGFYRAAILSDPESKMEDELEHNDIIYPSALNGLIQDMLKKEAKRGPKHRVLEGVETGFSIDNSKFGQQSIRTLYENMVVECKDLKLYASTVRACNRKWCGSGTVHKSNVAVNSNGFQNITTSFVQEIRNYTMTCASKIDFDMTAYIPNANDIDRFTENLKKYLSTNQNLGRQVAKIIGNEAYMNGFMKETGFRYQYDRFSDMIQYTQNIYFRAKSITFTSLFEECLSTAVKRCIQKFIDAKCVMVY